MTRARPAGARRIASLVAGLAIVVAACGTQGPSEGQGGSPTTGNSQPSAEASSSQPARGTLVIGIQNDPSSLNPNLNTQGPTQQIGLMLYEPLVYFDNEAQEPKPLLAERFDISGDGLTYTFDLVKANFSDGKPMTSADVKYTILEVAAKTFAPFAAAAAVIKDVNDSDPSRVVITLSEPFGPFLLSLTRVEILPKHVFEGTDPLTNPASTDKPVGTGPFLLDRFTRGTEWVLVRNPDYWQDGFPLLDSIVARVMPDAQAAGVALIAGEVKYVSSQVIPPEDAKALDSQEHLVLHRDSFAPNATYVMFNTTREVTGKVEARKALMMAIDREFIHQNVFGGFGEVARAPIDSRLAWATNETIDFNTLYPYDPAAAGAALDAAGYPLGADGSRFSLSILVEGGSRLVPVAEAIASMFQEVGVQASVDAPEASIAQDQAFTPPGDFDIYVQSYTTNGDPALGTERIYVTDRIGKPFGNASGYSNPEVDALFKAGRSGTTQDERAVPYKEVQTILAEQVPSVPLIETALYDVVDVKVDGLWYAANWGQWQRATVAP